MESGGYIGLIQTRIKLTCNFSLDLPPILNLIKIHSVFFEVLYADKWI